MEVPREYIGSIGVFWISVMPCLASIGRSSVDDRSHVNAIMGSVCGSYNSTTCNHYILISFIYIAFTSFFFHFCVRNKITCLLIVSNLWFELSKINFPSIYDDLQFAVSGILWLD